jgi:transposase-like protein
MKKHRYSNEFKVTAVKMATARDIETKAVAEALNIHPFMLSRWKKEYREGTLKGSVHPNLKEQKAMEVAVAEAKRIREVETGFTAHIRFYNHYRLHSGIDYHTPEEYERLVV